MGTKIFTISFVLDDGKEVAYTIPATNMYDAYEEAVYTLKQNYDSRIAQCECGFDEEDTKDGVFVDIEGLNDSN